MKRKVFFVLVFSLIILSFGIAQESGKSQTENFPSALGFSFNTLLGPGFCYQHWFGDLGLTANLGGMYMPTGRQLYSYTNGLQFSLEPAYIVSKGDFTNWFSGKLFFTSIVGFSVIQEINYNYETLVFSEGGTGFTLLGGAGIGLDFVFFKHFGFCGTALYAAQLSGDIDFNFNTSFKYRF